MEKSLANQQHNPVMVMNSIEDISSRLLSWCSRASKGLSRIEYVSDFSRQDVLRIVIPELRAQSIPFYELSLPMESRAEDCAYHLFNEINTISSGVLSIKGFPNRILIPDADLFFRIINANRENLVKDHLRQIWWLSPEQVTSLIQLAPDLNSWFMVRLQLSESLSESHSTSFRKEFDVSSIQFDKQLQQIDEIRKQIDYLIQRFEKAVNSDSKNFEESFKLFIQPAMKLLQNSGAENKAQDLYNRIMQYWKKQDDTTSTQVFISYAESDKAWAEWVAWVLKEKGYAVKLQAWHIRAGHDFVEKMHQFIDESGAVVAILSPAYLESKFCQYELRPFLGDDPTGDKRKVFLIRIVNFTLPRHLQTRVYIDLAGIENEEKARKTLLDGLEESGVPTEKPSFPGNKTAVAESSGKPAFPGAYPRYWTVPNSNPLFTGREEVLQAIHDYFSKHHSLAITQAIKGLGGIGKTQAAIEYAHRFHADYSAVLWIRAEKQEDWKAGLAEFARQYSLASVDMKEDEQTQAARVWLGQNNGWLLILDNLEDLSQVEQIFPRPCAGRILVTTRQTALGRLHGVSLECMDDDTGALFLLRRIGVISEDEGLDKETAQKQNDAKDISRELGGLPLALDQAGAYITETGCGLQGYLKRYQDNRRLLLAKRGADGEDDHLHSVDTTFALCFEKLQKENPAVELFLQMCAFMAPDAIPEEIFTSQDAFNNDIAFDQCIADCAKYSLVKRNVDNQTLSLHRLTQVVLRERLEEDKRKEMAEKCVLALAKVFPDVKFENWPQCRRLLPHAMAISEWIEAYGIEIERVGYLCNQIAAYLWNQGRYAEAEPLYLKAIAIVEKALGLKHPLLATYNNNLALLYKAQGRYEAAELLYKKAIAIGEKTLGEEHPLLATYNNNLALLYKTQGRYEEAEPLYKKAIAIGEKTLGLENPDLATWYNNLASLYRNQGRYEDAEPLYKKAIVIIEKAFGLEHPNLASGYNNLAILYWNQGRYEQAEPLYKKAIAIVEKVLSKDHPGLATYYENYGLFLQETGREEEAKVYLGKAEAIWKMRGEKRK